MSTAEKHELKRVGEGKCYGYPSREEAMDGRRRDRAFAADCGAMRVVCLMREWRWATHPPPALGC
jgi:hypothetical protein